LFAFEPAAPGTEPTFEESGKATRSPNLVVINVSPIEYGHVLLCPRVLDCLPQNLDPSTARLALHFALEVGNPYLRVGFNSLGAFATINHLHFQVRLAAEDLGGWRVGCRACCVLSACVLHQACFV
jgi:GDP-L-galactose phosphorylase